MTKILRSARARGVSMVVLTALLACSGEVLEGTGSSGTVLNSSGRFLMNSAVSCEPPTCTRTGEIEGLAAAAGVVIGTTKLCGDSPELPVYPPQTGSCYGFEIGESVRFGLGTAFQFGKGVDGNPGGGIGLGELVTPREILTLVDLLPGAEDETNAEVVGMAQYLLTEASFISNPGPTRNGSYLELTQNKSEAIGSIVRGPNWYPIDFTNELSIQCAADLINGCSPAPSCNTVIPSGTTWACNTGGATLVSAADAEAAMAQTLRDIYTGCYRGTFSGDASGDWVMFVDDDGTIDQVTWPGTAAAFTGTAETNGDFAAATAGAPADVSLSGTLKSGGDYQVAAGVWATGTGQAGELTGSQTDEEKAACL